MLFRSFFGYMFDNNIKVDVYLLSDKLRYPENIAYDVIEMITMIIMIWTIKSLSGNGVIKKYINCFLFVSLVNLVLYFVNYNQFSSFFTMPLLITMLYLVKIRNK